MVIIATLVIMWSIFLRALNSLEILKVEVLDVNGFSSSVMVLSEEHEYFGVRELASG